MRSVQLPDHFHNHVVEFLVIGYMLQKRFVFVFCARPIDAVHLGIIEAVLHHAPSLFKNLLALSRAINHHAHSEINPARTRVCRRCRGTSGSCDRRCGYTSSSTGSSSSSCPRSCTIPTASRNRNSVQGAALQHIEAASITRPLRLISATTALPSSCTSAALSGSSNRGVQPLQPGSVIPNNVNSWPAACTSFGCHPVRPSAHPWKEKHRCVHRGKALRTLLRQAYWSAF